MAKTKGVPTATRFGTVEVRDAGGFKADRRLYLNSKGEVVEEGDPDKRELLAVEGDLIPLARARAVGLVEGGDDEGGEGGEGDDGPKPARAPNVPAGASKPVDHVTRTGPQATPAGTLPVDKPKPADHK